MAKLGYRILRFNVFQEVMKDWEEKKQFERISFALERLHKAYSPKTRKKNETEQKQYLFCVMVSDLLDKGYNIREASEIINKKLDVNPEYVRNQYYQKLKEIEKNGLTIKNIKERYGLTDLDSNNLIYYHYKETHT